MTRYVICPKCGFENSPYRTMCKSCSVNLKKAILDSATETPTNDQPLLSPEERHRILEQEIAKYVHQGYRVVSQSETTAQLVKPKELSLLIILLSILGAVVTFFVYLFYYLVIKKDKTIYIEVMPTGTINLLELNRLVRTKGRN